MERQILYSPFAPGAQILDLSQQLTLDSASKVALYGTESHILEQRMARMATAKMKDSPYRVQVIDRVLGALEILAHDGPALTLGELSQRLGLPKSTMLRLLMVLEQHRFVQKDARSGVYRLGLKLFELGSRALAQLNLGDRAKPHLARLVFITSETAFLCVLDDGEALSLERVESSRAVRVPSTIGWRAPAHCTAVGKALLAFLPESDLAALVRKRKLHAYTPNTITSLTHLRHELQTVRERGYAVDQEEMEEGLKCIAAPVRDHSGKVIASLGILSPAFRLPEKKIPELAASIVNEANELSAELGYHVEPKLARRHA
jgi:DNA-binding IclR family transcriptional regulator